MPLVASQLPPVLQAILPVLAADQGRIRARTLLFLVGVGPDVVDQHLADLDPALGSLAWSAPPGWVGLLYPAEVMIVAQMTSEQRDHRALLRAPQGAGSGGGRPAA